MNFEEGYFTEVYNSEYDKRNPRYKFKSYFKQTKKFAPEKSKILDIGCAYGSFLNEVKDYYNISGCDISEHAISIASKRIPDANLFVSDINNIPLNTKYDLITCFDIIEHVPKIDEALEQLKKLLADNAILCITVPVYDTLVGKLVEKLDKDPTHIHKNSRYWWLELLKKHDFEILSWKGIWRYYLNPYYLHYITSITKTFSPAIIIIARKKLK